MKFFQFLSKNKKPKRSLSFGHLHPSGVSQSSIRSFNQNTGSRSLLENIQNKNRRHTNPSIYIRRYTVFLRNLFIILSVIGFLYWIVSLFLASNYLKVSRVEIIGAGKYVNESDIRTLVESNVMGKPILAVDTSFSQDILKKNFLGAKDILVKKSYPSTIQVFIRERVPLAVIYNSDKNQFFLIDSEGYVLGQVERDSVSLPKIIYSEDIIVGTFVEKEIVPLSAEIIDYADKEDLKISSMSFFPKYMKVFVNDGTEVLIGNDKNKKVSLESVSALVKKAYLEGKKVSKIDLRYGKVVVSFD